MGAERAFAGGKFALAIDGLSCGILKSCQPGTYKAEVIEIPAAQFHFPKKTIGQPKPDGFQCEMGIDQAGKPLQAWVQDALDMKTSRRNGSLFRADFDNKIKSEIEFREALFTELTLPACSGDSKDPGLLKFNYQPEWMRTKTASGDLEQMAVSAKQKQWLPMNFRFKVDGLPNGCNGVSKVDALTFKCETTWDQVGDRREFDLVPTKMSFSNVKCTFAERDLADWQKWYDDYIVAGQTAEDVGEKTAVLEYLTPDLKTALLTVNFSNLGLLSLSVEKDEKGQANVRRLTAEMYCESWKVAWS